MASREQDRDSDKVVTPPRVAPPPPNGNGRHQTVSPADWIAKWVFPVLTPVVVTLIAIIGPKGCLATKEDIQSVGDRLDRIDNRIEKRIDRIDDRIDGLLEHLAGSQTSQAD